MGVFKNVLIGLDNILNCCIRMNGEWGYIDETLSSRVWRLRTDYPRAHALIDGIFFWETKDGVGHCEQSYNYVMWQMYYPPDLRTRSIWGAIKLTTRPKRRSHAQ